LNHKGKRGQGRKAWHQLLKKKGQKLRKKEGSRRKGVRSQIPFGKAGEQSAQEKCDLEPNKDHKVATRDKRRARNRTRAGGKMNE